MRAAKSLDNSATSYSRTQRDSTTDTKHCTTDPGSIQSSSWRDSTLVAGGHVGANGGKLRSDSGDRSLAS